MSLSFGTELFNFDYEETFISPDDFEFDSNYNDQLLAGFVESDIFLSNKFAMKLGARFENTSVLEESSFSPRLSLAYQSSDKGQFSFAFGEFYQNPQREVLKFDQNLRSEKTSHYILNYQYLANGKTFRAEAYYKGYDNLIKYNMESPQFNSQFSNLGLGYATGLDLFWRDNKSVENFDYWVSYSYLDTERDFRNFRELATPNFAAKHNLSVVSKYWMDKATITSRNLL